MIPKIFQTASEVIDKLEENGHEAFFVGGSVRDFLLNKEVKDIDIATSASPTVVQTLFDKVIPVGIDHGTVIVRHKGVSYEVTTFRQDGTYSDQRHPDEVIFINTIEEDLKRRDFTINALAMNKQGNIIDLFEGQKDIQLKKIRSVGNARERFLEDPLRIIRALRFSSQLGFEIETETLHQMKRLNKEIETVAVERLTNEFTKLFQGEFVQTGIDYLMEIEGHLYIPILKNNDELMNKIPRSLTPFHSFAEVIAMFHYLDKQTSIVDWVKEWKCSNQIKLEATNLVECLNYYKENGLDSWLVYQLNCDYFSSFLHLLHLLWNDSSLHVEKLNANKKTLPIQNKNELDINGYDLLDLYPKAKRGPWMKKMIEKIEYNVVMNKLENRKQIIKEWIMCHPPEQN